MIFRSKAKEDFQIESIVSDGWEKYVSTCVSVYSGTPYWVDEKNGIKTINFAKALCSETARLAMLGTKITIDGSARAKWLQEQIDAVYYKLRQWVEYGCAYGTIALKPNGKSVDLILPGKYIVTDQNNGDITGAVFVNQKTSADGKRYYTRLEYHRYTEDGLYMITNRCYVGSSENDMKEVIDIAATPWSDLAEEVAIENAEKPLFAIFKMPHANNVDIDSPMGMPLIWDALEELKDLDVAYSRNSEEIFDSAKIILLDSDRLVPSGGIVAKTAATFEKTREEMNLPKYVKNVYGNGQEDFYKEINPQLNTDTRLTGINALLSQIGYKVGYSNGYFVFNESTGIQTATGVEAEQQRTIQFIKDIRDQLEKCIGGLVYALNAFADLYNLAPVGRYEVVCDFGDITYNREEDRARWWGYVSQGRVPAWMYFVKFEGMSEEDARAMVEEAQPKKPKLFGLEE